MNRSLLAVSVFAALLIPASAEASTVSATGAAPYTSVLFQAGPGPSDVTLTSSGVFASDIWSDAAQTLTAGAGCTAGVGSVTCPYGSVQVNFRNANDRFTNTLSFSDLTIHGNGGADTITANGESTWAYGDGGSDTIDVNSNGTTRAFGGTGADDLRARGGGAEMDGGDGTDLVVGQSGVDKSIAGGAGADQVFSVLGFASNLDGGPGNDTIVSLGAGFHTHGTVNILGGDGADTIQGSAATTDQVDAGIGKDVIDVYDGNTIMIDTVTCGPNVDWVYADATDTVAADCEHVVRGPAPDLPAVDAAKAHLAEAFPDAPQVPGV